MDRLLEYFMNKWPYTDFHELNADWLISTAKELIEIIDNFIHTETLKFSDPILWNITTQYAKATIVIDVTGNAYLSKQPVPSGIQLNDSDYWLEIFNFTSYTRTANKNLTVNEEINTTRATSAHQIDDWLIWNDVLYKVTSDIVVDELLIAAPNDNFNIIHFTVEDFIKAFITYATGLINQYKNDIDASELAYRQQLAEDIASTTSSLQEQLNAAISGATVDSEVINARVSWFNVAYDTLKNALDDETSLITKCFEYPISSWTDDAAIRSDTGSGTGAAGYSRTNFIDLLDSCTKIAITAKNGSTSYGYAFTRADNTVISSGSITIKSPAALVLDYLDAPVGAKRFRFSTYSSEKSNAHVFDVSNVLDRFTDIIEYIKNYQMTEFETIGYFNTDGSGHADTSGNWYRSNFVEIPSDVTKLVCHLYQYPSEIAPLIFYNEDFTINTVVTDFDNSATRKYIESVYTVPTGAKFFRASIYTQIANKQFVGWTVNTNNDIRIIKKELKPRILKNIINKPFTFNGANIVAYGDSIMKSLLPSSTDQANPTWTDMFIEHTNANNFTVRAEGGAVYNTASTNSVLVQLQNETNWLNRDFIFILAGTNDYNRIVPLDVFESSVETTFNYLDTQNVNNAQVIVITPIPRSAAAMYDRSLVLDDYREIITKHALLHDYSVIDGRNAPFDVIMSNYQTSVMSDGIHPTQFGYELLSKFVYNALL